ncbi:MAG TPA: YsnF/AvaK domain-containing protein [Pyrinomonadaceae bacterium]|nr:YsnF/AvaK domain-containing protein [Pyrinomonadaceae bacterium]
MAKTVIGLFDNRSAAQGVVSDLLNEGFTRDDISVVAKQLESKRGDVEYVEEDGHEQVEDMAKGAGTGAAIGGAAGLLLSLTALAIPGIGPVLAAGPIAAIIAGAGIGATAGGAVTGLTRLGLDDHEAGAYAEGVRRGGTLVSVNAPDDRADSAVGLMKRHGAIEIDKRAAQWREEGWTGFDASATHAAFDSYSNHSGGAQRTSDAPSDITAEHERVRTQQATPRASAGHDEIALPVVEERLEVGKREVERGGVRVQSRVSETPVERDVQLREEHVHVERNPVDYTFHGGESEAFKEAQIEIREAYEELIVNKKARVVEEVVIGKDVEQHTETVRETLRRTDVEVEQLEPGQARSANASAQPNNPPRGGSENV